MCGAILFFCIFAYALPAALHILLRLHCARLADDFELKKNAMIIHVVMWKFKENAEGCGKMENAARIKEMLEALYGVIPQIQSLEVGLNINGRDPKAYDAVLVCRFRNMEDLELYKSHPEHKKISAFCKLVRESRVAVDYEIPDKKSRKSD